jgi:hypothetical protein
MTRRSIALALTMAILPQTEKHSVPDRTRTYGHEQSFIYLSADEPTARTTAGPRLDRSSGYLGPSNPSDPSHLAICDPEVRRAIDSAWGSSMLASHRPPTAVNDKIEYGFTIQADPESHLVSVGSMVSSGLTGK